jgi:hypothetical protein
VRIKVHDGTTPSASGVGLCGTFRHAYIRETERRALVLCTEALLGYHEVTDAVVRCRDYAEVGQPSKWDLEKIAWTINVDTKTKKVGFLPPGTGGPTRG